MAITAFGVTEPLPRFARAFLDRELRALHWWRSMARDEGALALEQVAHAIGIGRSEVVHLGRIGAHIVEQR